MTVAVLGLITLLTVAGLSFAAVARAGQVASAAADLGALAAAGAVITAHPDPCAHGRAVVEANGAVLDGCVVLADESVQVSVHREVRVHHLRTVVRVTRVARAGPVPN